MQSNNQSNTQGNPTPNSGRTGLNQVLPVNQQTNQLQMQPNIQSQFVLGPDGKPLLGPDGQPVVRHGGGHHGGNHGGHHGGQHGGHHEGNSGLFQYEQRSPVLGADGKPVIGPDGQPVMRIAHPHTHMQPVVGPDGKTVLGPDGKPVMKPVGGPGGMTQQQQMPGGQSRGMAQQQMPNDFNQQQNQRQSQGGNLIQSNQNTRPLINAGPQDIGAQRLAMQQQRFQNPTGQARWDPSQNSALQNIDPNARTGGVYASGTQCWGQCSGWFATYICCCCCDPPYKIVPQGFTGVIQRFGKYYKLVPPGMHYLVPDLDELVLVDKREQLFILKKQVVQTRDNVTITIDAMLYFKIEDSYKSKFAVNNLAGALKDLTETILRNAIGRLTLQEVLQKKEELSNMIMEQITQPAFNWGVAVTRALIQEIFFGRDQQGQLSQGAISKKIAEAKVITSQADVESARLMKEASSILATEAAMQIRYLESLESIAKSANPKFVFFPADFKEMGTGSDNSG